MLWGFDVMMDDAVQTLARRLFPEKRVFLCRTPDR